MKKLYHGSLSAFDEIDLSAGKGYKDFGKGFYATAVEKHAERLAIKIFTTADAEWLRFIVANRKSPASVHDYDIVIGPTADAQTTTIINEHMEELEESGFGEDVCDKVIAELMPENLPKQYFFGTEEALKTLKFDKIKRQVIL